ncbi:MAG: polysaccharide biosynthesis tyrosine autokinase, partial [Phycisphaerae bacterium]|nr:polysaccharide biosynthesis tyrosine autokinase [Phycisphaerae bacterium]
AFFVIGGGGTGGLVFWYFKYPYYTATGYVRVEPGGRRMPGDIAKPWEAEVPFQMYDEFVQTVTRNIERTGVLNDALRNLESDPAKRQTMFGGTNATFLLYEELAVSPVRGTQFISVSLTGLNTKEVADIVNAVLGAFMKRRDYWRKKGEGERLEGLEKKQAELQSSVLGLAERMKNFRQGEDVPAVLDVARSEELARLQELTRQLTVATFEFAQARAAFSQYERLREQKETQLPEGGAAEIQASPAVSEAMRRDQTLSALRQQRSGLRAALTDMTQKYGPNYKARQSAEAQLKEIENELERKSAELLKELEQQQAAFLAQKGREAAQVMADISARVDEARTKVRDLSDRAATYAALQVQYESKQELLNIISKGIEDAKVNAAVARSLVSTIPADPPWKPSQPSLSMFIPLVSIAGLLFGIGLAFAFEFLDTTLRSPADIVRTMGLAMLGSIPERFEDEEIAPDEDLSLIAANLPHSLLAEAFRQVRTSLLFSSDQPVRRILVTSPNPGDGKTTTACNLAATLAASGSRVLLVEGNLRRPALHKVFDLPNQVGLSNLLAGLAQPSDVIQATAIENLSLITCGPRPPNPAELLGSKAMSRFLAEQGEKFDTVL